MTDAMIPPITRVFTFGISFHFELPLGIILVLACTNWVEPVKPEVIELGVIHEQEIAVLSNSDPDCFVKSNDGGMVVGGRCSKK